MDTSQGARTQENITHASKTTKIFSVSNKPLFENIPLKNVVIDNLHLFLRVSDVLTMEAEKGNFIWFRNPHPALCIPQG